MTTNKMRFLNMMQNVKIKKEKLDDDTDAVHCKLCAKGFASNMALMNHAKVEHIAEYVAGEDLCMGPPQPKVSKQTKAQQKEAAKQQIKRKTQELISSMSPTNLMSFASPDVSYIIIKTEDDTEPEAKRRKERTVKKKEKQDGTEKIVMKKDREPLPISSQQSEGSQIQSGHNVSITRPKLIVNNRKKEYQKRYRELNREKLKQREAERRKRKYLESIGALPNVNEIENDEYITPDLQTSILRTQLTVKAEEVKKTSVVERKREAQRRYRIQNREKLKQREMERRNRLQAQKMAGTSTPWIHVDGLAEMPLVVSRDVGQLNTETEQRYSRFVCHRSAHVYFNKHFRNNEFGHACSVCDRLWFKKDLRKYEPGELISKISKVENERGELKVCATCKVALDRNQIPNFSVYNGFRYPKIPEHLPKIDFISERLIAPRIPFMQIRRLRHVEGQLGTYGQIINIPISDAMVTSLPRNVNNDNCIYVNIGKKLIYKSCNLIDKEAIKQWLDYLVNTPLYKHYQITIDESFFNETIAKENIDDISEKIDVDYSFAQEQTLVWNEEKYLKLAIEKQDIAKSSFVKHVEELSFPSIYMGKFRKFRKTAIVTPFMMASSELRRSDRRGVKPCHLLYMADKIMRIRVRDCLITINQSTDNIAKEKVESEEGIDEYVETNLEFLRSIPNSVWYWTERKNDVIAMIRQLGIPTAFMTLSANEVEWADLVKLLYKLSQRQDMGNLDVSELSFIQKTELINNDAVTCALYFEKLVNVIMKILHSIKFSPFGRYRVKNYFLRIDFERGSPKAYVLLWLDNAPSIGDEIKAIEMIDSLTSVSKLEASGNDKLLIHKHNLSCYKKTSEQKCRFEPPFMPCKSTMILVPMDKTNPIYKKRYDEIRNNLERNDYISIDDYYESNNIGSEEEYKDILRSGINKPTVFYKRKPSEKWHNPFNPFVLNVFKSNMDFQIIVDEYACAEYVDEYINKRNRGISDLKSKIKQVVNENPEFDIAEITKKLSVDILNAVEMSPQEAAWYLLRLPMSKSSISIQYIDTRWPGEREKVKGNQIDNNAQIWKDCFDKYKNRPEELEEITLAQFVSTYTTNKGEFVKRAKPTIIRYKNYNMSLNYNDFRREMVTLHVPFRDEVTEILEDMKFTVTYYEREIEILEKRKEFESGIDIQKTIDRCQSCREDEVNVKSEVGEPESSTFEELYIKSEF